MSTLFISDLHLSPDNPELIDLATQFLVKNTQDVSALYILGDLFNTWLGDDVVPNEFSPFVTALQHLQQQGIKLYLMVGNRDFMLGRIFAQQAGCQLLTDPTVIELYGQQTLLMHGDSLCTDDISYQRYRLWSRNKLLQWCFLKLPTRFRQNISDKIKQKSSQKKQYKSAMIMDVNSNEVDKVIRKYKVKYLIHGHTHRPAIHSVSIGNTITHRIVLGDWYKEVTYLKCDDQTMTLVDHRINAEQSVLELS
ncbi:UDP-2,3-diacylglucosamine diphosphatase [Methylophaga sp. 42_8_T64]|nr:UDP-2,3-diacylglucosamine diphosphatase [Methylophaga sp. 41_12_T18]OUR88136.1 UDP-2,3-diacylglucosamine diphosphatase [Methylophaga sp. 42_8_T64]